jgi:hypothetical protein
LPRIEGHLHRLGLRQEVVVAVDHGLAQLHRGPLARFGEGDQPLEHIRLQIGIGVKHQHPAPLQLLEHEIEGPGLATARIAGTGEHLHPRIAGRQLG